MCLLPAMTGMFGNKLQDASTGLVKSGLSPALALMRGSKKKPPAASPQGGMSYESR